MDHMANNSMETWGIQYLKIHSCVKPRKSRAIEKAKYISKLLFYYWIYHAYIFLCKYIYIYSNYKPYCSREYFEFMYISIL